MELSVRPLCKIQHSPSVSWLCITWIVWDISSAILPHNYSFSFQNGFFFSFHNHIFISLCCDLSLTQTGLSLSSDWLIFCYWLFCQYISSMWVVSMLASWRMEPHGRSQWADTWCFVQLIKQRHDLAADAILSRIDYLLEMLTQERLVQMF